MNLQTIIYTTNPDTRTVRRRADAHASIISRAKGVTVAPVTVKKITLPDHVPTFESNGGIRISWDWIKANYPIEGNALCLNISHAEHDRLGLRHPNGGRLGGTYNRDPGDTFEFVVIGDLDDTYPHEISHGFSHWTGIKDDTHLWAYELKNLAGIFYTFDFRKWGILNDMVEALKKLLSLQTELATRATYPFDNFVEGVTQAWMVENATYKSGYHNGLDIRARLMSKVYAPYHGKVYLSGKTPQLGNYCFFETHIDEQDRYYLIPHLDKIPARREYTKGETIAFIGNTGLSTAPHGHITSLIVKPRDVRHYVSLVDTKEKILKNTRNPSVEFRYLVDRVII